MVPTLAILAAILTAPSATATQTLFGGHTCATFDGKSEAIMLQFDENDIEYWVILAPGTYQFAGQREDQEERADAFDISFCQGRKLCRARVSVAESCEVTREHMECGPDSWCE